MKLSILFALCSFFAMPAFSETSEIENQVLQLIVSQSATIQLVNLKGPLPEEQQLPALIADQLSKGYLQTPTTNSIVLGGLSVACKNTTTPDRGVGAEQFSCDLSFSDGDFIVNRTKEGTTLTGPRHESAINFTVEVTRVVYPNAKPTLNSKIIKVTTRAG